MSLSEPVFVTGASGFIGDQLSERLLREGRRVRVLGRRPIPALEALGAELIPGDLHDLAALRRGCEGAGTVFHVAARVGVWGPPREFFHVNVGGTQNLIAACRAARVARLVHTSSPSVVYQGHDLCGVDESSPLCTEAPSPYPTSKAAAEKLVAAANGAEFGTVSLRPHLVWGPGDRNLIPRVFAQARCGRLKIVGSGQNRVDCTHIANVVDAHLLAEKALANGGGVPPRRNAADEVVRAPAFPGGKAYFITNGEPVVLWTWINELLRGVGLPEVTRRVSFTTAWRIGGLLETAWRILPLKGEPPMTRFIAKELATDHWFDISAARRDLGYEPRITMATGTAELIELLRKG